MDILAHGLWAGLGATFARRYRPVPARTAAAVVALAVLPDLAQLLPLLGLAVARGDFHVLYAYATALPGGEPALPPAVALWSHHLHCVLHSAVMAAAVTALAWALMRTLWLPLLGWWSHIVIDVFTHSAEFYPSPVLYPFTYWGFDGLAWNTPWFMVLNYAAIAAALVWWLVVRRRGARVDGRQGVP
ncbi:MAG: metal-dependent hydrolase [Burkholderiaceae bacterium]|nr:metal-dependent hydrolase [Burkholderiaceae bacterium]